MAGLPLHPDDGTRKYDSGLVSTRDTNVWVYNGTLTLTGPSGVRNLVYGGNLGAFSGLFNLNSPTGILPASVSRPLASDLYLEGVVGNSLSGGHHRAGVFDHQHVSPPALT